MRRTNLNKENKPYFITGNSIQAVIPIHYPDNMMKYMQGNQKDIEDRMFVFEHVHTIKIIN